MSDAATTLDDLGLTHGTDKSSSYHNYLNSYEYFLSSLPNKPRTVLEIGVLNGASLKVWRDYFPEAQIIGADIVPASTRFAEKRVAIEIIDQSNIEDLVQLGIKWGPFDVIVEDGSHMWEHQITTLQRLYPFVRPGGLYIVEDLQISYGVHAERYRGVASHSCVEYLKRLMDYHVANKSLNIANEQDSFIRTYGNTVDFMAFIKHACIIKKGEMIKRSQSNTAPLISGPAAGAGQLQIIAHIGDLGDQKSTGDAIAGDANSKQQNIQGFALQGLVGDEPISYRAKLRDGNWTEWVKPPNYVGTRGASASLTGFAVRLDPGAEKKYDLKVVGLFRGHKGPVVVGSGQDCVAGNGLNSLYGAQVQLIQKR